MPAKPRRAQPAWKLQEIENIRSLGHLFESAEKIADQVNLGRPALDFLYKNSRWNPSSRVQWEKDVRTACAIDRIIRAYFRGLPHAKFADLIDQKARLDVIDQLKSAKGTLLLTFHGGFVKIAQIVLKGIGPGLQRGRSIITRGGERAALFNAMRKLEDGGTLLIAPDGPVGKKSGSLNVLGTSSPAREGAAFIAYASNCSTAWFNAVRQGNSFVPIIEPGPRREGGESYNQFGDRLYRFYSQKIEAVMTGDPRNMALRSRWTRVLRSLDDAET